MYTGRGKRTRIAPFTRREGINGARLIVAAEPHTAMTAGVSALSANRFTTGTAPLQQMLAAARSPWVAQDLQIGNPKSTGLFHTPGIGDPDDALLPFTWSFVVPALAIVCARPTPNGTELVMFVHPSPTRSFGREGEVRPLMTKAYAHAQRAFVGTGALLHHEPLERIDDASCPASLAFVTGTLGWD